MRSSPAWVSDSLRSFLIGPPPNGRVRSPLMSTALTVATALMRVSVCAANGTYPPPAQTPKAPMRLLSTLSKVDKYVTAALMSSAR